MNEHQKKEATKYHHDTTRDMLAAGPDKRQLIFELITTDEEKARAKAEDRIPLATGFSMHQHCEVPLVSEEGIDTEWRCDMLVLDINQLMQLKDFLSNMTLTDLDGNEIDDE